MRHQENSAQHPYLTQPGWCSLWSAIGTPPRPREERMLRDILLIARPPLLAVMRGGEFARFKMTPLKHPPLPGGLPAGAPTISSKLIWTAVPSQEGSKDSAYDLFTAL